MEPVAAGLSSQVASGAGFFLPFAGARAAAFLRGISPPHRSIHSHIYGVKTEMDLWFTLLLALL
jgi:hypothetical protein